MHTKLSLSLVTLAALSILPAAARAQVPTDVRIANPPSDPGQVVNPRDTFPVVLTQQVSAFSGTSGQAAFGNIVPQGYRLIVEHVSFFGRTPVAQRLWGIIHPCDNLKGSPWGTTGIGTVSLVEDSSLTNAVHFGSADTALYVDAGCTPTVSVQRNGSSGSFSAWITLQGHFTPLPGPAGQ
jgi:hypothetical protein